MDETRHPHVPRMGPKATHIEGRGHTKRRPSETQRKPSSDTKLTRVVSASRRESTTSTQNRRGPPPSSMLGSIFSRTRLARFFTIPNKPSSVHSQEPVKNVSHHQSHRRHSIHQHSHYVERSSTHGHGQRSSMRHERQAQDHDSRRHLDQARSRSPQDHRPRQHVRSATAKHHPSAHTQARRRALGPPSSFRTPLRGGMRASSNRDLTHSSRDKSHIKVTLEGLDEQFGLSSCISHRIHTSATVASFDAIVKQHRPDFPLHSEPKIRYYAFSGGSEAAPITELCRAKTFSQSSVQDGTRIFYQTESVASGGYTMARNAKQSRGLALRWAKPAPDNFFAQEAERPLDKDTAYRICVDIIKADNKMSVQQAQTRIANATGIDDVKRIVLVARNGFLRGSPLVGLDWQLKPLLENSLCTLLEAVLVPPDQYLVVEGGGGITRGADGNRQTRRRTYVLPHIDGQSPVTDCAYVRSQIGEGIFQVMKKRLAGRFAAHAPTMMPESACSPEQTMALFGDNGQLLDENNQTLHWGSQVEFRLPDDSVEEVAGSETWLLLPTVTCMLCIETKAATEFPHCVTASCLQGRQSHESDVCKACLADWIHTLLEEGRSASIKCSSCSSLLSHADVRLYANADDFARYDRLLAQAAITKHNADFFWCLAPGCGSGQIAADLKSDGCRRLECHACRASQCVFHNLPWHKGETCEQYDVRMASRLKQDAKSTEFIEGTSKQCPQCKSMVHKYRGCNHITCSCGHEWCYICFAPYVVSPHGILHCKHRDNCIEEDLLRDLGLDLPAIRPLTPRAPRRFHHPPIPPMPAWGMPPPPPPPPPPPGFHHQRFPPVPPPPLGHPWGAMPPPVYRAQAPHQARPGPPAPALRNHIE